MYQLAPIKLKTGIQIRVPVGLPFNMGDGGLRTGFQVFFQNPNSTLFKQDAAHLYGLSECLKAIPDEHKAELKAALHPFGGFGIAEDVAKQVGINAIVNDYWERDDVCAKYLVDHGRGCELVKDSFSKLSSLGDLDNYDLLYFDCTTCTVKTRDVLGIWGNVASSEHPKYVFYTDTACSKAHLHKTTYATEFGRKITGPEDYFVAYDEMLISKYRLKILKVVWEHAAAYMLIGRLEEGDRPGVFPTQRIRWQEVIAE